MTHERIPNGETQDGPEHDHSLPDAEGIPVYEDPADSDGPPLDEED